MAHFFKKSLLYVDKATIYKEVIWLILVNVFFDKFAPHKFETIPQNELHACANFCLLTLCRCQWFIAQGDFFVVGRGDTKF